MSLNDIQLQPLVLQELFKNALIECSVNTPLKEPVPSSFTTLGNNKKNIVIIVESVELYLPDEELNFLLGILSACQLTMEDVAILNIRKHQSPSYKTITTGLKPEKLFLFGVSPEQIALPLAFPHYQIQQYNRQIYLIAPSLYTLQQDKAEKTKLWNCLKEIFAI